TQGARLAVHYGIAHISTGEMLRNAIKHDSPVGRVVKDVIDQGRLVADDLIASLVKGRLGEADARTKGYLLDGFPRTLPQAHAMDEIARARPVNIVVDLEVPREVVMARLSARLAAEGRADDSPAAVEQRLALYEQQTAPLIAHYRRQGTLAVVDGLGTPDEVFARLVSVITSTTGVQGAGGDGKASR
ncbi:MAG: nucleoside monophosphate kinase, partial [Actinobacteria bacterium]|nr:nucleoside monophosphate kinase [Actinomycetota bacterium]NBR92451.1 nucleoside monophosphate kinase [Actinomycetota bacterium]